MPLRSRDIPVPTTIDGGRNGPAPYMNDDRPDPDALLAQVLGMCPGVGKTYAMLLLARQRQADGLKVLVGVVETHGRKETAELLENLEILPRKKIEHGGHTLEEFDLDTAIQRRPDLLLVDELAHTNASGSRHLKRYQDVLELLDAGIDVVTRIFPRGKPDGSARTGAAIHRRAGGPRP